MGIIEIVELAKYCLEHSYEDSVVYFNNFIEEKFLPSNFSKYLKEWLNEQNILEDSDGFISKLDLDGDIKG